MFYLIQAGSSLQSMSTAGVITTLTLPTGVTIDSTKRGRFAILGQQIVMVNSPSINLWIDIGTNPPTVRAMGLRGPVAAPVLSVGAATGLTGTYRVKVGFFIKDPAGHTLQQSPLSGSSLSVALTDDKLNIDFIPLSLDSVVFPYILGRRLYRTVADGSVFFQMQDLDDNVSQSIITTLADAALELLPEDPDLGNPPGTVPGTSLELITVWKNRLWAKAGVAGEGDDILFTTEDFFYAWPGSLPAYPKGEDEFGITGFLARRDELGVLKRRRVMKVLGSTEDDFEVVIVAENVGCVAPDSCVVIRDIGYFLGLDGVYTLSDEGVTPITRDKVDGWFNTDTYFNRGEFTNAIGGYNPKTDTYDLHLSAVGSTNLDRWISYDIKRKEWLGPHKTDKFTPTQRCLLADANSNNLPAIGSSDGYLYKMNQTGASDQGTAIAIDWITKFFAGGAPDITHFWDQAALLLKKQSAGTLTITPKVGDLDAANGTAQSVDMSLGNRVRLARWGVGRLLRLQFTHSTDAQDVELYGLEQPFNEVGRR